ncbi:CF298 protein, partial [Polyodon spathula]|nr:CF298 protein [Polyodon spathula]
MVQLHVKRGDESQFLFTTTVDVPVEELTKQVTAIYNGRLKVDRICSGRLCFIDFSIQLYDDFKTVKLMGSTEQYSVEAESADACFAFPVQSRFAEGNQRDRHKYAYVNTLMGFIYNCLQSLKCCTNHTDPALFSICGALIADSLHIRHTIKACSSCKIAFGLMAASLISLLLARLSSLEAPNEKMKQVLLKTVEQAKSLISKKQVQANECVTLGMVKEALDQLRGAVMIVYPMGLPPHDPIRLEFEDREDLSGTQAALQLIADSEAQLWWAAKELHRGKKLTEYVGKNEKTKIIVKIQKRGQGAPAREPVISPEEQKQMMMYYSRRQEELKKLQKADDDSYFDSEWADRHSLKKQFQGLGDIKWGPR